MNYNQYPAIGIDHKILIIQNILNDKLGFTNVDFYGRALRVLAKDKKSFLPEVHVSNTERKEVYYSDKTAPGGNVFFVEEDENHTTKNGIQYEAKIKIVFMLNLEKIYQNKNYRADSEIHETCIKILKKLKVLEITAIEKGLNNVLKGFNTDLVIKNDLQPYHIFSINGILKYTFNCNH
jgi:hypothetical protein